MNGSRVRGPSATTPAVSVAIPCFNRAGFIADSIRSVAAQTFDDWELIVVDDGSSDGTPDVVRSILRELSDRPQPSKLVELEKNRGVTAAVTAALDESRGRYFAYLGSDDLWDVRKLEKQVAAMGAAGDDVAACFTDCWVIDEDGQRYDRLGRQYPYRGGDVYLDLLEFRFVPPSPGNFFVREKVIAVGGFNPMNPRSEDYDLWVRLSSRYRVIYLDEPLASYRVHRGNISTSDPTGLFEQTLQTLEEQIRVDPRAATRRRTILGRVRTRYAGAYFNALQLGEARREALHALRYTPLDRIAWRIMIGSLLGRRVVERIRELNRSWREKRDDAGLDQ